MFSRRYLIYRCGVNLKKKLHITTSERRCLILWWVGHIQLYKGTFLHGGFHEGADVDTKHLGIYVVPKISSFFDENVEIVNMLSFTSLRRMGKLKKK